MMDKRAWLEVADPRHRYAKNLRSYYQAFDLMGLPGGDFFAWLASSGFELERCPRSQLDGDTVHYCDAVEAETHRLEVDPLGRLRGRDGLLETPDAGWIFVLRDGAFYAAAKRTEPPRFHHSSFFAGACVEVAGMLVARAGVVTRVFPHSGHYRPGDRHILFLLRTLAELGLDLGAIEVDGQRTLKVARHKREGQLKKSDRPHLVRADALLHFLELKQRAWSSPLFAELAQACDRRERVVPALCLEDAFAAALADECAAEEALSSSPLARSLVAGLDLARN
jgi:hypothetical protein